MTLKEIKQIIELHEQCLSPSQILKALNNEKQTSNMNGTCQKKDAIIMLVDNRDKEYYFKDRDTASQVWSKYIYPKKGRPQILDWLEKNENGKFKLIKSI